MQNQYYIDSTVVGCLLDVSGSMRQALETDRSDQRVGDRLRAVLGAALKLARAEHRRNPRAVMFVAAFGLNNQHAPVVDLCEVADALFGVQDNHRTGHDLLIALANQNDVAHITDYIKTKLTADEARIVYLYLRRHPESIREFVQAIPAPMVLGATKFAINAGGGFWGPLIGQLTVDRSDALKIAQRICDEWLLDFDRPVSRPVADVIPLLERLQEHPMVSGYDRSVGDSRASTLLDALRPYLYGGTPMCDALARSLEAFRKHPLVSQRVLVLVSDGHATDGDPLQLARQLAQDNVTIATVYLTSRQAAPSRRLYDRAASGWDKGQGTLFRMAGRVAGATHPIPVLASMGWEVPSSGECALYATVCSSEALEEFCMLLLSARFGSADALLDVVGRVRLDAYIDDEHVRTRKTPSNQGHSGTCYAHATAAVLHMALVRIVGREGGSADIPSIRKRILDAYPPTAGGYSTKEILRAATDWYRPLRFREVDEDGARQAVLHRRPVLTTFYLSRAGWDAFTQHFERAPTSSTVLSRAHMEPYRRMPADGGHAVVLVGCNPRSLTFLNSWGRRWGDHGSFSIEDKSVLDLPGGAEATRVHFYDVYWLEDDLTRAEQQAYNDKVDSELRARAVQHASILEMEARCPSCVRNAPIADFRGSIRQATCPLCHAHFAPEPGHLVQALYARAGIGEIA